MSWTKEANGVSVWYKNKKESEGREKQEGETKGRMKRKREKKGR
jgi:hypothetical protein